MTGSAIPISSMFGFWIASLAMTTPLDQPEIITL
jgi:hypothetical protein